jgi:uncharacterized protein HemX
MKDWITQTGLDAPMLLFGLAALLLIATAVGMVFATRLRRRWERQREERRVAPENAHAMARWIEEGRQLLNLWRERVERLDELQGRLAAMALEIDQLRAQVISLSREGEALLLERDQLRSILVRIGELIQRASEARPGATEGTDPEVGP